MIQESLSTKELAAYFHVESQTIRRGLCVNGHYLGLRPLKLQNGRLLWPKTAALQMVAIDQTAPSDRKESAQTRQR